MENTIDFTQPGCLADRYVKSIGFPGKGGTLTLRLVEPDDGTGLESLLVFNGVYDLSIACTWTNEEIELVVAEVRQVTRQQTPTGLDIWDWQITFGWPKTTSAITFSALSHQYLEMFDRYSVQDE